jgi:hypothetical protein
MKIFPGYSPMPRLRETPIVRRFAHIYIGRQGQDAVKDGGISVA